MKIMERLKQETQAYHTKLEALPYFKALMEHRLPLTCYVRQLKALAIIHRSLENALSDSNNQFVNQKGLYSICSYNFECKTNICSDRICISNWQKILNWFKRFLR